MRLKDYFIVSDIDGTLIETPNPIPPRNLEALRYFTAQGGHFALATGRAVASAGQYVRQLPVNAPCILFNGAGVYDYAQQRLLFAQYLPETFRGYLQTILERFPTIGTQLHTVDQMFVVSDPHYVKKYIKIEHMRFEQCALDRLQQPFLKLVFVMDEDMVEAVDAFASRQPWEDVAFCRSGPYYVEMLPRCVNKGAALRWLAGHMGLPASQVVAIGDFYNDLEMLQAAGISATVAEAPAEIKRLCSMVVGSCKNGALADLIERLEQGG